MQCWGTVLTNDIQCTSNHNKTIIFQDKESENDIYNISVLKFRSLCQDVEIRQCDRRLYHCKKKYIQDADHTFF